MKRIIATCLICLTAMAVQAQSQKTNFDFGWKFMEADVSGAQAAGFDDSGWQSVNLPHDWDIYHAPAADGASGNDGGFYPGGIGWYRKTFLTPKGTIVRLHFEGVYQRSTIYVNGMKAGSHAYGYTPFSIDVTPYLNANGINTVAVRVDNSNQPGCRWYSGSGINRHTWLEVFEPSEIDDPAKLFIRVVKVYNQSDDGTKADSVAVRITYEDRLDETRIYKDVRLWSPSQPALYDISVGRLTVKYGFRTFTYSASDGFRLNGQPLKINGACVHHDDGLVGAMAFDQAEIRKVRLMKNAGFNLIRTSHNPTTRAFLDACDSIGLMVIDEMYDGWYESKTKGDHHIELDSCYQEDFQALVTSDRNHPSVICWSIGNEVIERKDIRVIHTAKKFRNEILKSDDTRPVTEALCSWDSDWEIFDPHADVLDIVGYNYMLHKHAGDHERDPERVMWQTESYPRDAFRSWAYVNDYPYIIGDMVWTGLDYLGESGIGQFYYDGEPRGEHYQRAHFPFHGAYCGDVDLTGWRKPVSHYRDMLWNVAEGDCSSIYLAAREPSKSRISTTGWSVYPTWESWNWDGFDKVDVEVYTKAPAVNLYLNDKLIGTKKVDRNSEYKATFQVDYQQGTLRAVAVDAKGVEHASCKLVTAGQPYSIRLTPERKSIKADGEDLAYVLVEIVDKAGNVVPDADMTFEVSVSGVGSLLTCGSASLKDIEPLTSNMLTTYKGRGIIVARSTQKKGGLTVSATTKGRSPRLSKSCRIPVR